MKTVFMTIAAVFAFGMVSAQPDSTYSTTTTVTKKSSEHTIERKSDTRDTIDDTNGNAKVLVSDSLNRSTDPVRQKEKRARKTKVKKVGETITK